ncbi:amidase [Rhodococcus koreensis]
MLDYSDHDALSLADLVRRREVSPIELVEAAIERIEALNPTLNAVVFTDYEDALTRAARNLEGPFAGVPMLLKDIGGLKKGWPTRQASDLNPDTPSLEDSTLVARYEAAGLIPLGKTNVPEFGIVGVTEPRLYGPARNPWNTDLSPGGSSGGSAAAVASGMVPVAHAGDGGGSIRIPASCCGLVGLKPTRARTGHGPQVGDVMGGLVIDHIVSRTVRDTAAMLDATAGPDLGDPYFAPPQPDSYLNLLGIPLEPLRIGFATTDLLGRPVHPDCRDAVEKAATLCEAMGHHVEESSPKLDQVAIDSALRPIWGAGHAMLMRQAALTTRGREPIETDMAPIPWAVFELGRKVTGIDYLEAWATMHAESRKIANWHEAYDLWLTPTIGVPPVVVGELDSLGARPIASGADGADYVPFTRLQNMSGQPAVNVPIHWSTNNLPIGVQFVGRFGADDIVLQMAAAFEEATPWIGRRPPIWR